VANLKLDGDFISLAPGPGSRAKGFDNHKVNTCQLGRCPKLACDPTSGALFLIFRPNSLRK
jgi:hypothetical protein